MVLSELLAFLVTLFTWSSKPSCSSSVMPDILGVAIYLRGVPSRPKLGFDANNLDLVNRWPLSWSS